LLKNIQGQNKVNDTGGKIAAGINDTGGKIAHWYQQNRRQILPPVLLVLLIPVANNGNNIRLLRPDSEQNN
jgi:hypothetical protein